MDLAQVVLPGSVLERRAHALFSELQQRSSESSETKTEGEEHQGQGGERRRPGLTRRKLLSLPVGQK